MQKNNQTEFQPYISAQQKVTEFSLRALILGLILAIVFAVANAYLGLKVGMTVSASIPAAVISMAILRGVLKKGTVLENNIVQTIGSSGESLAAGVIFTIPAFIMWGMDVPMWKIILISVLGGFLGILFMIPLRRFLIVKEHGKLLFPEGTACAEILIAGDEGGGKAKAVFTGVGISALYKFLMSGLKLWQEEPLWQFSFFKGSSMGISATPALGGVGFILGPRIACMMFAGAVFGYMALGPLIAFIGNYVTVPILPATVPISQLDAAGIRSNYIKYIGAGAVALGGLVSLFKAIPIIVSSFGLGFKEILKMGKGAEKERPRTDQDIPMWIILLASFIIAIFIWLMPGSNLGILGAILAVIFSFFFVTVAARICGLVGSSASPVSGMTIAAILVTALIFLSLHITGTEGMIATMTVGAVVCIAICMSGDASQDLKTGFLVGATPKSQQIAEFAGVLIPALFIGPTLFLLNKAYVLGSDHMSAPQATIMSMVVKGVMTSSLPWIFVSVGMMIGVATELLGIPTLAFAIGLYLSPALSSPILIGGIIHYILQKSSKPDLFKRKEEKGILFSSGMVAGDALTGVLVTVIMIMAGTWYEKLNTGYLGTELSKIVTLIAFAVLCVIFWLFINKMKKETPTTQIQR
jgi:putative OPT family oligopeptide transporter